MTSPTETEVKIPLSDNAEILERLHQAGFALSVPRQFESNTIYDSPDLRLRHSEMILRLREVGGKYVVTWKGPGKQGRHKSRPELETTVGSMDTTHQILGHLGFEPVFRYEKYRREFTEGSGSSGVITLDETPIGDFLELEGPGDWIDETATRLGFSQESYVVESYGRLYQQYCVSNGLKAQNMVFAS